MDGVAIDAYPILRAAVSVAAVEHWRTLRAIAPAPDPRCVAAETVASQACYLMQSPALWEAIGLVSAVVRGQHVRSAGVGLAEEDMRQLSRQIEALDHAVAAWSASAYSSARGGGRRTAGVVNDA